MIYLHSRPVHLSRLPMERLKQSDKKATRTRRATVELVMRNEQMLQREAAVIFRPLLLKQCDPSRVEAHLQTSLHSCRSDDVYAKQPGEFHLSPVPPATPVRAGKRCLRVCRQDRIERRGMCGKSGNPAFQVVSLPHITSRQVR